MGTNYIAPIWRMPENNNQSKFSNYNLGFDTSSQGINIGSDFPYPSALSDPWSISFWIKPNQETSSGYIFSTWGDTPTSGFFVSLRGASEPLSIQVTYRGSTSNSYIAAKTNDSLTVGQWQHVVVAYNGSRFSTNYGFSIYVDKNSKALTLFGTTTQSGVLTNSVDKYIGQRADNTGYLTDCGLTQLAFFDYELSENQVTYLYNLNNPMAISGGKPIAYYPLGDNSNPTANAGYPNISVGADSVFNFVRTNTDSINLGEAQNLTGEFSISIWIKPDLLDFSQVILGDDAFNWIRLDSANEITFRINGGGGSSDENFNASAGISLETGIWQHLFFNRDSSNNIRAYKNGSLFSPDTNNNSDTFIISKIGTRGSVYYDGEISNVQVWDTSLSTPEITTLYNNGQPLMTGTQPQAANLKAWYKLNESSNWEADSVGNWQIPDATSAFPQSFKFIAANSDAIQFGPSSGLGFNTQISISAWFNQTPGGGSLQQLVAEDKTGSSRNWGIILVSRVPNFQFFDETGAQVQLVGTALTEGKWHHILCTATGDTSANGVKMYINGQLVAQGTASNENIKNDNIQAKIGTQTATTPTYYFDGKISNVALWNTDRSSEKDNIYNNGIPATSYTTTPQYWYKLDSTSVWNPAPANYWTFPNAGEQDNSGIFNFSN